MVWLITVFFSIYFPKLRYPTAVLGCLYFRYVWLCQSYDKWSISKGSNLVIRSVQRAATLAFISHYSLVRLAFLVYSFRYKDLISIYVECWSYTFCQTFLYFLFLQISVSYLSSCSDYVRITFLFSWDDVTIMCVLIVIVRVDDSNILSRHALRLLLNIYVFLLFCLILVNGDVVLFNSFVPY